MSSNDLVNLLQEYGVTVELMGTEDQPSPNGMALGGLLMEVHRLRRDLAAERARVERLRKAMADHGSLIIHAIPDMFGNIAYAEGMVDGYMISAWLQPGDLADGQPGEDG